MKRWKIVMYVLFSIVLIFKTKDVMFNYKDLKEKQKESTQIEESFNSKKEELDRVLKGDNREKYFREEYKISEEGDILFVFPEDESTSSS